MVGVGRDDIVVICGPIAAKTTQIDFHAFSIRFFDFTPIALEHTHTHALTLASELLSFPYFYYHTQVIIELK